MAAKVRTVLVFWTDNKMKARATIVNDVPVDADNGEVAKRMLGIPCLNGPDDWNGGGTMLVSVTADMIACAGFNEHGERVEFEQGKY